LGQVDPLDFGNLILENIHFFQPLTLIASKSPVGTEGVLECREELIEIRDLTCEIHVAIKNIQMVLFVQQMLLTMLTMEFEAQGSVLSQT